MSNVCFGLYDEINESCKLCWAKASCAMTAKAIQKEQESEED